MKERLAIIDGIRTPMAKADTELKGVSADDLGAQAVKELLARSTINKNDIDEVVFGNVATPADAVNIARVVALKAGLPPSISAMTVSRNCASGMEAISTAYTKILAGEAEIIIAGGTESMSNIPFLFSQKMKEFFTNFMTAKSLIKKLKTLFQFRYRFLKPVIGVLEGLTDPVCGLIMGLTAENLSRDFQITREEQDKFALESHEKATKAIKAGIFKDEIVPIPYGKKFEKLLIDDSGPRPEQSMEALAKLKPYFDRKNGTVTVGNSCPINDGAAAVLVMLESKAKSLGLKPLGYVRDYAYAALDPSRMGLGPVYATSKVFDKTGLSMKDIEIVEINEAFAAQVLACEKAFSSDEFSQEHLNKKKAIGPLDLKKTNVNGGAIALGHPVGMTGARLVLTLLKEMRRSNYKRGLATLCVGGGQGAAFILESA